MGQRDQFQHGSEPFRFELLGSRWVAQPCRPIKAKASRAYIGISAHTVPSLSKTQLDQPRARVRPTWIAHDGDELKDRLLGGCGASARERICALRHGHPPVGISGHPASGPENSSPNQMIRGHRGRANPGRQE
jgi:hypothetical protein